MPEPVPVPALGVPHRTAPGRYAHAPRILPGRLVTAPASTGLTLASGSGIRRQLLVAAGLRFDVDPPDYDEAAIREDDPSRLAAVLAHGKAKVIADRRPDRLVLGGDQVFTLDGRFVPKPTTEDEVVAKLSRMSGREHVFYCGWCLLLGEREIASGVDIATVRFHDLTDDEIRTYAATGEGIGCAGGYRLEEGGVRLIREIDGSHFTVLGLPMLSVMNALRDTGHVDRFLTASEGFESSDAATE